MTTPMTDPDNVQFEVIDTEEGLTEEQAVAFLEGNLDLSPDLDLSAEMISDDENTGAMIALLPTTYDAEQLAIDGGIQPAQLHMTLYYLDEATEWPPDMIDRVADYCTRFAADYDLLEGEAFGAAIWNPKENPSIILNIGGCDCFEDIHKEMGAGLPAILGAEIPTQYSPWVPHICLAYSDDPALLKEAKSRVGMIEFDRIRVAFGSRYVDILLTGD